jgi:hypothetical protein
MIFFDLLNKPVLPKSLQLRIPYMGSKRKIAEELMQMLLKNYFGIKNKIFNNIKLKQGNLF